MADEALRLELFEVVRRLDELGLNHNASGNASVRARGGTLVTPTGIAPADLSPADMVRLDEHDRPASEHALAPTSEWRLHTEILRRRPDVDAIVHTHSIEATAVAVGGRSIPPVHYVAARFGAGHLRCAPYHTYGTSELAVAVADTLGETQHACLLANHGAIALGRDLRSALELAVDVEWFCAVFRRAETLGDPVALDDAEVERVATLFQTYGQPGVTG